MPEYDPTNPNDPNNPMNPLNRRGQLHTAEVRTGDVVEPEPGRRGVTGSSYIEYGPRPTGWRGTPVPCPTNPPERIPTSSGGIDTSRRYSRGEGTPVPAPQPPSKR